MRVHALALPVHAFFALVLAEGDARAALARFGALLAMLAAVLVHEMAHGLVARRAGLAVLDVRLHALGGVARIERPPQPRWRPRDEWVPALAGPLGNLVVAAVVAGLAAAAGRDLLDEATGRRWADDPVGAFFVANAALGVVNLVPAFPADGGRVLRAALATRLSYLAATRVALGVGAASIAVGAAALASAFGTGALLFLLPVLVLLAVYGAAERRAAVAWEAYGRFYRFVEAFRGRHPALGSLPLDRHGLPVPRDELLDDPALRASWEAFEG